MSKKSIPVNIVRRLWSACGGYCQNPKCNKFLFTSIGEDYVSLANVAHIIGRGKNGPRSEHELAQIIDKDGLDNLIMLCLDCHKVVDELEKKFSVEEMQRWKADHEKKIRGLFNIPTINDEKKLLTEVNELIDQNKFIFQQYGPYSQKAIEGESGDTLTIWRRRCLDTILPNNRRIVNLIEKNKRNFPYPWDVYQEMLSYKLHVEAFEDNCLIGQKVNDYKLFPIEFDHFIKTKLGIKLLPLEVRAEEELEFRRNQISKFINRFLADHNFIAQMEELNSATMFIELKDQRTFKVFVTNTYYFTEYTFNKVMAVDPQVDVIICSNPYGQYSESAKNLCIENRIGLFMLREFMGAIRKTGDEFLNYLLRSEERERLDKFRKPLRNKGLARGLKIYLLGSYLRRKVYRDIDITIVYEVGVTESEIDKAVEAIKTVAGEESTKLDFTICSTKEFSDMEFYHNNLTVIYT